MKNLKSALIALHLVSVTAPACGLITPDLPADNTLLDGPLADLTPTQNRQFLSGDEHFSQHFTQATGLGPLFNATSCASCHPGDGRGHPEFAFTRFGLPSPDGSFDPLQHLGGPQLQDRALPGHTPETLPTRSGLTHTRLIAPPVTGLGLLEHIPAQTLLDLADPDDLNQDNISGRIHYIPAQTTLDQLAATTNTPITPQGYIGRFGRKATHINLMHQAAAAYLNDMGITSTIFPQDLHNPSQGPAITDQAPDPELSSAALEATTFYLLTLRPPARRDQDHPEVRQGQTTFTEIGCASCHIPTLKTGPSTIEALSHKTIHPYTDLLLHDLGPELDDGYTEGDATSAEWRTPPLWGLGLAQDAQGGQLHLMHDGRARTLNQAIELHGGEASHSRQRWRALTASQKQALNTFLNSL